MLSFISKFFEKWDALKIAGSWKMNPNTTTTKTHTYIHQKNSKGTVSFERHCSVIFSDWNEENNRSNNKNAQPLQFLIPIKSKAPAVHIAWFKILWFQLSARFRFCIPTNLIFIMENRLYFNTVQICDQIAILFSRLHTHTQEATA